MEVMRRRPRLVVNKEVVPEVQVVRVAEEVGFLVRIRFWTVPSGETRSRWLVAGYSQVAIRIEG